MYKEYTDRQQISGQQRQPVAMVQEAIGYYWPLIPHPAILGKAKGDANTRVPYPEFWVLPYAMAKTLSRELPSF